MSLRSSGLPSLLLAAAMAAAAAGAAGCAGTPGDRGPSYETPGQRDARTRAAEEGQLLRQGDAALADGDLTTAAAAYHDAATANPKSLAARLGLATIAERQHLDGEAERWLRDVLALDGERVQVRYRLVSSLLRQRRVADARKEFQLAHASATGDEKIELRLKAAIALRSGQVAQAARLFDELIELAPNDASGYLGLGVTLAVGGDLDGAEGQLTKALDLAPRSAIGHYDMALVHYKQGDLEHAVTAGKQAIELDPYFMPARNNLAATLLQLTRADEAKRELVAAIAMRPGYAPAHNNLGIVLLAGGDASGAAGELEKAVHHAPRVAAFHFNLGLVYFRLARMDDARTEFAAVVSLDADNPDAARNLRWLDGLKAGTIKGTDLPAMTSKFAVDEFNE